MSNFKQCPSGEEPNNSNSNNNNTQQIDVNTIPGCLAEMRRWHHWKFVNGSKIPFQVTGEPAKSDDPTTWTTLDEAVDTLHGDRQLAFELSHYRDLVGVDLDNAFDDDGNLRPWAEEVLSIISPHAYLEVSPSGTGLKAILHGRKPDEIRSRFPMGAAKKEQTEVYGHGRFWAWTGDVVSNNLPEEPTDASQDAIEALCALLVSKFEQQRSVADRAAQHAHEPASTDELALKRATAYASKLQILEGDRNNTAYHLTQKVRSFGCDESQSRTVVFDWNSALQEPLGQHELSSTFDSAWRSKPYADDSNDNTIPQRRANGDREPITVSKSKAVVHVDDSANFDESCNSMAEAVAQLGWDDSPDDLRVYNRGGQLVGISVDVEGQPRITALTPEVLERRVSQCCNTVKKVSGDSGTFHKPFAPKAKHMRGILNDPTSVDKFKPLNGSTNTPTVRPDGTILQTPGYDESTGMFFHASAEYADVPENPSKQDALDALNLFHELLSDFPLRDEASVNAWVSMLLAMIARPAIKGCTPLFAIDGNTAGSGKGLLVSVASMIARGTEPATTRFSSSDDELEKRVTSLLLADRQLGFFDNVRTEVGGPTIEMLLTSSVWRGRILGKSESPSLPVQTVFCVTGNNLTFSGDTYRRVLPIVLKSKLVRPQDRTDVKHKDLVGYVKQNRAMYVKAALTILRAYFVAGCPDVGQQTWGSFTSFTEVVTGAIVYAGGADPMLGIETSRDSNTDADNAEMLLAGIESLQPMYPGGLRPADMLEEVEKRTGPAMVLAAAFDEIFGDRPNPAVLGRAMKQFINRAIDHDGTSKQIVNKRTKYGQAYKVMPVAASA